MSKAGESCPMCSGIEITWQNVNKGWLCDKHIAEQMAKIKANAALKPAANRLKP